MKYEILFLGKTKGSFLAEGISEYLNRLKHYTNVSIKVVKSQKMQGPDALIKDKESRLLFNNINSSSYIVALDSHGKEFSSSGFSSLIDRWEHSGIKHLTFVIGGPLGFSKEILNKADLKISLSKMTFTHDMVRLFLIEQIYRAYTIKAGEKYHK
jgi:23S rRNA (pseudouridine1915-N3)-methyltransferase